MKTLAAVLIALSLSVAPASTTPASAQTTPAVGDPPTVMVSATATVRRAPDVGVIQLAVETLAPTAREASDENADRMEEVIAAIRGQGVPDSAIRTERLELQPRYADRREQDPEIVGYRAVNQVTVRLTDVTAVGGVVDAAVRAGANRVSGIHFELAEPEAAYHEALRQAIAKARAEAEVAASALGVSLGEPLSVSTGGFSGPTPMFRRQEVMAMGAPVADMPPPVEPGEVEVQATVSIAWRLGS